MMTDTFPSEADRRKKWQRVLTLKAHEHIDVRGVHRCRKIYFHNQAGTLHYRIKGDRSLEGDIAPGYAGGPHGPGGGAYPWGNIDFYLEAITDSVIYVHIEWETGLPDWPFRTDETIPDWVIPPEDD